MIRRPPRSTLDRSSAASDVYKRQVLTRVKEKITELNTSILPSDVKMETFYDRDNLMAVSYTHLRAHETVLDIVCRLLLEKKNTTLSQTALRTLSYNHHNVMHHTPHTIIACTTKINAITI